MTSKTRDSLESSWHAGQLDRVVDPDTAARLRAAQIASVIKVTPLMLLANIVCGAVVFTKLYLELPGGSTGQLLLFVWAALATFCMGFGALHVLAKRGKSAPEHASFSALNKVSLNAIILGSLWASIPAIYYPGAAFDTKLIIMAVISGMLGGGTVSQYVIPAAQRIWVTTLAIGAMIAALRSGTTSDFALLTLILAYTASMIKAGSTMGNIFIRSVLSEIESKQKTETINVLLGDFSENAADWLWETDKHGKITVGMDGFAEHFSQKLESFEDGTFGHPNGSINGITKVNRLLVQRKQFKNVLLSNRLSESERWLRLSGKPLYGKNEEFIGFRGVASDISEAKQAERKVTFLAQTDALTGLVNRMHFTHLIDQMFTEKPDGSWAILSLDLDGFKSVNDTHGHAAGDQLLVEVANRLRSVTQKQDIVSRLGGDEFIILVKEFHEVSQLERLAQRVVEAISREYVYANTGAQLQIGTSIGIAIGGSDGKDAYQLLNNADLALYRAKSEGKGVFRRFEIEMDEVEKDLRKFEADLREAVKDNSFSVSYQPLVSADGNDITGFEALVRWKHPVRGQVSPAEFIPVAERIGLISQIGDFVLQEACKQATTWPEHITIAINLSPQQFINNRITKSVTDVLISTGLDPRRLELEITEGLFMEQTDAVTYALRELKSMGVSIAMDDFGTGYSSLSYLLKFPFDKLKIDQSFIRSIDEDQVARNVLEAIAKLGNILDLKVTVEGVETADQVKVLKDMDCSYFQGYLFGKPLSGNDLGEYLQFQGNSDTKQVATEHHEPPMLAAG